MPVTIRHDVVVREMRFLLLPLAFAAIVLTPGCGDDTESGSPIPSEGTIFEYTRSGGLAFSIYEVSIEADGTGTVSLGSDVRDLEETEFTLTEPEVEELHEILEEHPISSLPGPGGAVCADCFEYSYSYGGDEYALSGASEPVEELDALRDFMADLPLPPDQPNFGGG